MTMEMTVSFGLNDLRRFHVNNYTISSCFLNLLGKNYRSESFDNKARVRLNLHFFFNEVKRKIDIV